MEPFNKKQTTAEKKDFDKPAESNSSIHAQTDMAEKV